MVALLLVLALSSVSVRAQEGVPQTPAETASAPATAGDVGAVRVVLIALGCVSLFALGVNSGKQA